MPELERDPEGRIIYRPDGEILRQYVASNKHVAAICGPIGSGTSTGSCFKLWRFAMQQAPHPRDKVRRTRFAIIRNTYPDLEGTTVRTWLDWFEEDKYGRFTWSKPMKHTVRCGDVEMEADFLALDVEEDIRKLLSTEYTGFWFNELRFIRKSIFDEAESRCGRFPAMKDGGPTWDGVIADTNAPDEEHWLPRMTGRAPYPEEVPESERQQWPSDWDYFEQPPALVETFGADGRTVAGYVVNPEAENQRWLKPGFYAEKMRGKTKAWIDSRLMNRITFFVEGDPVWRNYRPEIHRAPRPLPYVPEREVIVSCDFGRSRPAALIAQEIGDRVQAQREFRMYGVPASIFAPNLKRFLEQNYRGAKIKFTGDPKCTDRGSNVDESAYDIFKSYGMVIDPPKHLKNNNLETRIESVAFALQTNRLLISPECTTLCAALAGKYAYKKIDLGEPEPIKDKYSDIADCLQYLCLFLGEGRRMIGLSAVATAPKSRNAMAPRRSLRRATG